MVDFKSWINDQYINWRGNSRKSITDFARYIGVSQQIMNQWVNDGAMPGNKTLPKLAAKYPEIYYVLDLSVPDPFPELPREWAERFFQARREYTAELSKRGMLTDSPEARRIIADAFARHGINFTFTDGGDDDDN